MELLAHLFPESGLNSLFTYPDLYSYFNQIYSLHRGFDLVPPQDTLCQVVILSHILDDLFHGMRHIHFGISQDENAIDLGEAISHLIESWSQSSEDMLVKTYLPLLSDYCRLIETERESLSSPYAAHKAADLAWYKKHTFFPHLSGTALASSQALRANNDSYPFYKTVSDLKKYLTQIAKDIDSAFKAQSGENKFIAISTISNPFDLAFFEVENPCSKRIQQLLKYEGPKPHKFSNSALIYYTLSILSVLDYLMNDPNSWSYSVVNLVPYRSLHDSPAPYIDKLDMGPDYLFSLQIEQLMLQRSKQQQADKAVPEASPSQEKGPSIPKPDTLPPQPGEKL
jgi:hypothetical protein